MNVITDRARPCLSVKRGGVEYCVYFSKIETKKTSSSRKATSQGIKYSQSTTVKEGVSCSLKTIRNGKVVAEEVCNVWRHPKDAPNHVIARLVAFQNLKYVVNHEVYTELETQYNEKLRLPKPQAVKPPYEHKATIVEG